MNTPKDDEEFCNYREITWHMRGLIGRANLEGTIGTDGKMNRFTRDKSKVTCESCLSMLKSGDEPNERVFT